MVVAAFWRVGHGILPGHARAAGELHHRGHDGALRRHRPRATGGDADGRRDDRQPLVVGPGDGRRGHRHRSWSATGRSTAVRSGVAWIRPRTAINMPSPLLATLTVADAMEPATVTIGAGAPLATALARVRRADRASAATPSAMPKGGLSACCPPMAERRRLSAGEEQPVRAVMQPLTTLLERAQPLDEALKAWRSASNPGRLWSRSARADSSAWSAPPASYRPIVRA